MIRFIWRLGSIALCAALGWSIFSLSAAAETSDGAITVNATIQNSSSGGGCSGSNCNNNNPPADNAPVISNVAVNTTPTTAAITWQASDDKGIASSVFVYGPTASYGNSGAITGSYRVDLSSLQSNAVYFYKISVTDTGNHLTESAGSFKTPGGADVTPPTISQVSVIVTDQSAVISWKTNENADSQASYGVTANYGRTALDASLTTDHQLTLPNLLPDKLYHYRLVSTDVSGNAASATDAVFTTRKSDNLPPPPVAEICDNRLDDDNDAEVDCADSDCLAFSGCSSPPLSEPPLPLPSPPPAEPVGSIQSPRLAVEQLLFFTAGRRLRLVQRGQVVTGLAGYQLTVAVPAAGFSSTPEQIFFTVGGQSQSLNFDAVGNVYTANSAFPGLGRHQALLEVRYANRASDQIIIILESLPLGDVLAGGQRLAGVSVALYQESGERVRLENFGESNPIVTNANGNYGWMLPNGRYKISAEKSGYYRYDSPALAIENNLLNLSLTLVAKPPALLENINPKDPLGRQLQQFSSNLGKNINSAAERASLAIKNIQLRAADPEVQKKAGRVVAPATVGAVAVGTLALVSWADILPLLRLLFLQPLMLLGLRRRHGWGQVYNALNKLPVDLTTLRLLQADTGQVVQTKVTDQQGRYAFVAAPGRYRIEAVKNNLHFPSTLLSDFKDDGRRTDIYHGEIINVTEQDAVITVNIPLDPLGETKPPARLRRQQISRLAQLALSWAGLIITLVSFYLSPRWYVAGLLAIHLALFAIFRRLAVPAKIKSWGIVYDSGTNNPLGKVVARLFNSQFNKLVATQVTDGRGRYYFLAGDDAYYVTYERSPYQPHKTEIIDLHGKESETISLDVKLNR